MRPPPGGASTFVFGNYDAASDQDAGAKSPARNRSNAGGAKASGISAPIKTQIAELVANSADVNDLIKKMQELPGVTAAPPTVGGETNDRSMPGPRGNKPSSQKVEAALDALRQAFAKRGCDSLLRLGKKFHIMDDDRSAGLCFEEFKKGLVESGVSLSEEQLQALFRYFDGDCSGFITFSEFSASVREEMNDRRRGLVLQAFETMDANNDGALTVDDISGRYDTALHPDVVAGTQTEVDVLNNFLAVFDGTLGPKSAIVTPEKFLAYYSNISASIDNDDYFELVLRNVWHLSGGEGQFQNTTCQRLLVTHEDGTQTVEEVDNDFDVSKEDLRAIKENLREQGVPVVKVAMYGYVEEGGPNGVLTSTSSPRRSSPGPASPQRRSAAGGGGATKLDEDVDPEAAAAAYKSRMAQSNVSFA